MELDAGWELNAEVEIASSELSLVTVQIAPHDQAYYIHSYEAVYTLPTI